MGNAESAFVDLQGIGPGNPHQNAPHGILFPMMFTHQEEEHFCALWGVFLNLLNDWERLQPGCPSEAHPVTVS